MRITPLDVRKQEFKRGMRGYDADEVRAFLANIADEYEAVLVDNKQLRERVVDQDGKLGDYTQIEKTLRDTLMTAERVAQDARETARREGDVLMKEARQRVERVLNEGRESLRELRREALAAHREKEAYLGRFRNLAEAQIQFIEAHRSDFQDLDGRVLDQMDLASASLDDAADDDSAKTRTPSTAATVSGRDEWRDYAIELDEAKKAQQTGETPPSSEADQSAATESAANVDPVAESDGMERLRDAGHAVDEAVNVPKSIVDPFTPQPLSEPPAVESTQPV